LSIIVTIADEAVCIATAVSKDPGVESDDAVFAADIFMNRCVPGGSDLVFTVAGEISDSETAGIDGAITSIDFFEK
jgi:hypothetical protein